MLLWQECGSADDTLTAIEFSAEPACVYRVLYFGCALPY